MYFVIGLIMFVMSAIILYRDLRVVSPILWWYITIVGLTIITVDVINNGTHSWLADVFRLLRVPPPSEWISPTKWNW